MTRLLKPWMVLCVLGLSVFVSGQNGCNAVVNPGGGGGGGDPLAPLAPRTCGTWSGRFTGTLNRLYTRHVECPWSDGTTDMSDGTTEEQHTSDYNLTFIDIWGGDPFLGYKCAPDGGNTGPVRAEGTVEYTEDYTGDYDWGDSCRSHHSTRNDIFTFDVGTDSIDAEVEVHPLPYTYTEQQALLAERPCRDEYPIQVIIRVHAPATGGSGSHKWTERSTDNCMPCDSCPPTLEWGGDEPVDSNFDASYTAILYGTYRMDSAGHDTIEASYKHSALADPQPDNRCTGVGEDCASTCTDLVSEDYALTLTRTEEGDRDGDGDCDSVDPCPDDPWEVECEDAP